MRFSMDYFIILYMRTRRAAWLHQRAVKRPQKVEAAGASGLKDTLESKPLPATASHAQRRRRDP